MRRRRGGRNKKCGDQHTVASMRDSNYKNETIERWKKSQKHNASCELEKGSGTLSERCVHWRQWDCWGAAASGKDLGRLQYQPGLRPLPPQSHLTRHRPQQLLPKARINGARFQLQRCLALCCLFGEPSNKLAGFPQRSQMMEMSSPQHSWVWFKCLVQVVHFYYMQSS